MCGTSFCERQVTFRLKILVFDRQHCFCTVGFSNLKSGSHIPKTDNMPNHLHLHFPSTRLWISVGSCVVLWLICGSLTYSVCFNCWSLAFRVLFVGFFRAWWKWNISRDTSSPQKKKKISGTSFILWNQADQSPPDSSSGCESSPLTKRVSGHAGQEIWVVLIRGKGQQSRRENRSSLKDLQTDGRWKRKRLSKRWSVKLKR